jgi:Cyanobacterial TRADD-N associated 2-Transmembrane domain
MKFRREQELIEKPSLAPLRKEQLDRLAEQHVSNVNYLLPSKDQPDHPVQLGPDQVFHSNNAIWEQIIYRTLHYGSYISTGAGVVTEFIAAVFFYLYNRTVRQMKEYHDSLLSVQNILCPSK